MDKNLNSVVKATAKPFLVEISLILLQMLQDLIKTYAAQTPVREPAPYLSQARIDKGPQED